jgi:hypothetical protein
VADLNPNHDFWIATRSQTAQFGHTTTPAHSLLKPPTHGHNVVQKAEDIQQVRFPRRVGTEEKETPLQGYVNLGKIAPVFQMQMGQMEWTFLCLSHY